MSISTFNRRWAEVIIEGLTRHGVRHVCIAPGSRSTPLTLAAADHQGLIHHSHFDERGLGHLALGIAKASAEPVAVIVTSGTAVANLYPAVIEAGLTGEKLILLTADRPPELIDCGANQAIRQPGIFSSHPTESINLPRPSEAIPARWLVSTIDSALSRLSGGAIHINIPFAEPLYGSLDDTGRAWQQALGSWWESDQPWLREVQLSAPALQPDWPAWRQRRGVVLAGKVSAEEGRRIAAWSELLGWPLIGDVLSQTGQPLPCADLWLTDRAADCLNQAEIVVQFGGHLTGKRLLQWQATREAVEYWLVDPAGGRLDPAHHRGRRLVSDISPWLDSHPACAGEPWAPGLRTLARETLRRAEEQTQVFGEAQVAQRVSQLLPPGGQLFVGNSLTVRLIDALSQLPLGYPVFSNRGASGIDGLISTAAGVQRARGRATLAIVGDLSALYDINALALLRNPPAPLVLLVINNNGGQIFSMLPTPEAQREAFYTLPQNVSFAPAASMFGLGYHQPADWPSLHQAVTQAWQQGGTTLIELRVEPGAGVACFSALLGQAKRA